MDAKWDAEARREIVKESSTFLGKLISLYWRHYKAYCVRAAVDRCGIRRPLDILKTDLWNEAVGFAHGDIKEWLPTMYYTLSGLDISPLVCNLAKARLGERVVIRVGSITKLPFNGHVFDLVLDVSTIDHLKGMDYGTALIEYHRVLKAGGVLMLLFDNPLPFYWKPFEWGFNRIRFDNNPITTRDMTYWLEDTDFKIIKKRRLFFNTSTMIIARA